MHVSHGTIAFDTTVSDEVRVVSHVRRIAGGEVADVELRWDSRNPKMVLPDGSIHPAGKAGFRWTAAVCNLKPVVSLTAEEAKGLVDHIRSTYRPAEEWIDLRWTVKVVRGAQHLVVVLYDLSGQPVATFFRDGRTGIWEDW